MIFIVCERSDYDHLCVSVRLKCDEAYSVAMSVFVGGAWLDPLILKPQSTVVTSWMAFHVSCLVVSSKTQQTGTKVPQSMIMAGL